MRTQRAILKETGQRIDVILELDHGDNEEREFLVKAENAPSIWSFKIAEDKIIFI